MRELLSDKGRGTRNGLHTQADTPHSWERGRICLERAVSLGARLTFGRSAETPPPRHPLPEARLGFPGQPEWGRGSLLDFLFKP